MQEDLVLGFRREFLPSVAGAELKISTASSMKKRNWEELDQICVNERVGWGHISLHFCLLTKWDTV